jgi:predicted NBD/HSP70 family sugar kinase
MKNTNFTVTSNSLERKKSEKKSSYFIGFDIGGTKIEAMLIHFGQLEECQSNIAQFEYQKPNEEIVSIHIIDKKRIATERHLGYNQIISKMQQLLHEICEKKNIHLQNIAGVGLSVPGPVHAESGVITASNSMIMTGHSLHHDLKEKLKLPCPFFSENDANCFALAEVLCGAGMQYFKETKIPVYSQTAVGLILGSGFGGGIIVNGNILAGRRGAAGEVGHVTLYSNGHPCYCGRRGCAEQYLCGPALEAALNSRIYAQITKRPNAAEIFELYQLQDPIALAVVKQFKNDLSYYLGNITNLFDPHYFVLGGGLSLQDIIYENLEQSIGEKTFLPAEPIKVYKHKIGDSAGALGAVLTLIHKFNLNI